MERSWNSHYFWRVVFTIIVSLGHMRFFPLENTSTYIGVDYFFMVSGFFVATAVDQYDEFSWTYTKRRIKKLWPHVLFSFMVIVLFLHESSVLGTIKSVFYHFSEIVPGLYFVQDYSFSGSYMYNYPTWYLSCMLLIGGVIHYLFRRHREALVSFAPVVIVMILSYMMKNYTSFNTGDDANFAFPYIPYYIRALAEMLSGVVIYQLVLESRITQKSRLYYITCHILEYGIMAVVLYLIFTHGNSKWDSFIVVLLFFVIYLAFQYPETDNKTAGLTKRIVVFLSKMMYPVYLNHRFVFTELDILCDNKQAFHLGKIGGAIIMFCILFVYSYITMRIVERIMVYISQRLKPLFYESE